MGTRLGEQPYICGRGCRRATRHKGACTCMHPQCVIDPWMVTQQQSMLQQPLSMQRLPPTPKRPPPMQINIESEAPTVVKWEVVVLLEELVRYDNEEAAQRARPLQQDQTMPKMHLLSTVHTWAGVVPAAQLETFQQGDADDSTMIEDGPESEDSTLIHILEPCPSGTSASESASVLNIGEIRREEEESGEVANMTDL